MPQPRRACALEPTLQLWKPPALETMLGNQRSRWDEKTTHHNRRKPVAAAETQCSEKSTRHLKFFFLIFRKSGEEESLGPISSHRRESPTAASVPASQGHPLSFSFEQKTNEQRPKKYTKACLMIFNNRSRMLALCFISARASFCLAFQAEPLR